MQFSYLILVLAVATANARVFDLNLATDIGLAKTNEWLREHRYTSIQIPKGTFGDNVTFSESEVLGLDSLKRTGNCTLEVNGTKLSLSYHYGFGLYQQSFRILNIDGKEMSAGYRIRDNSVHLAFTIHNGRRCYVTLDELINERLAKVDFFASRPEYDGIDVEEYFDQVVLPYLNSKIDKVAVEKAMQRICHHSHLEISDQMPLVHQYLIEHFML